MKHKNTPFGSTLLIAFVAVSVFLSSCGGGKAPEHIKLIYDNASFVARIDVKQLSGKAVSLEQLSDKETLKQLGTKEEDAEKASKNVKRFLDSGIDLLNQVYVFSDMTDENDSEKGSINIAFAVDNEDKLTKFAKDDATWKDAKKKPVFKEEGKVKFLTIDEQTLMAWKGKVGIFMVKKGVNTSDAQTILEAKNPLIDKNESFKDAMGKNYDLSVWVNLEKLASKNMQANIATSSMGLSNAGTSTTFGVTFEKGKIIAENDYYGNEEIGKLNDKIGNASINSDILKNIPIAEPTSATSIALNLEGLLGFLREKNLLGSVEQAIASMGITTDDLQKSLTGDIAGTTGKLDFDGKGQKDSPDFVVSMGLKDKKAFEMLLDKIIAKQPVLTKKGDVYDIVGGFGSLVVKDKAVYLTMSENLKTGIVSGESKLSGTFKDQANKYAFVLYVGQNLIDSYVSSNLYKESSFGKVYAKDFPFTGGIIKTEKMKNKKSKTEIEVGMTDKSRNSLLVLIDMGKKANQVQEMERKKYEEEYKVPVLEDTVATDKPEEVIIEDK